MYQDRVQAYVAKIGQAVVHMPLFPAFGGRRWPISEFEASLIYRMSSRTARIPGLNQSNLKNNNNKPTTKIVIFTG